MEINKLLLEKNWFIRSSQEVKGDGKLLSSSKFKQKNWYKTTVPTTVLAALEDNKVYPNLYSGENLKNVPTEQFKKPWWYRTEFKIPPAYAGKNIWLNFDGIIYKADIWLNGHLIAGNKKVEGVYRLFKFNVTKYALPGEKNYLAALVYPIKSGDLSVGFCDWSPFPPDNNLGIWQDVYIQATGPVVIRNPHVVTDLELPSMDKAHLKISAELSNLNAADAVKGILEVKIENIRFSQEVILAPGEIRDLTFSHEKFTQLNIPNPRVWWPHTVGPQNLYNIEMAFKVNGKVSDSKKFRFGIRSVSSYLNKDGYRVYQVNGKNILIRGGGYTDDLLLRHSHKRNEAILQYVKNMNLNTIRLEGVWGKDDLFDLCDEYGILVMAGWTCHWEWKGYMGVAQSDFGCIATSHQMNIAVEYWKEQILRLRNHPGIFVWLYGSDKPPRPELEKRYIDLLDKYDRTRPYLSCAKSLHTELAGDTGVKMRGPYEYVPPFYYYMNKSAGGAFGFGTEQGPGAVIPRVESMRRMIPKGKLMPIADGWQYHSATRQNNVNDLNINSMALEMQYGRVYDQITDYCRKSQLMIYDAARSMFESWARNKYLSTGVIAWMLNSPWPSVCWQLFDWYLLPGGAFFGTQKACEPLHIQYSYDDNSIYVVNAHYRGVKGLKASAKIYNQDMREKYSRSTVINVPEDSSNRAFVIDMPEELDMVFYLKLELRDGSDKLISSNFYALSKLSVPGLTDTALMVKIADGHMPVKPLADFTELDKLPPVKLINSCKKETKDAQTIIHATIENPEKNLAFFIQLTLTKGKKDDPFVPVLWEDNYFSLMPGEKKEVTAIPMHEGDLKQLRLKTEGWNTPCTFTKPKSS